MQPLSRTVKIIFPAILFLLYCIFSTRGMAKESKQPPETVVIDYLCKLYEPVRFDHQMHGEMYDCCRCHHHTTGDGTAKKICGRCHGKTMRRSDVSCSGCHHHGKEAGATRKTSVIKYVYHIDKPDLVGALHLQCLGCHRSEDGPTGCRDCHKFTPAGRTRFALKK